MTEEKNNTRKTYAKICSRIDNEFTDTETKNGIKPYNYVFVAYNSKQEAENEITELYEEGIGNGMLTTRKEVEKYLGRDFEILPKDFYDEEGNIIGHEGVCVSLEVLENYEYMDSIL